MRKMMTAAVFALGLVAGVEAAPTDTVTQADLQVILQRLSQLEAENKAQAARIAELEGKQKEFGVTIANTRSELQTQKLSRISTAMTKTDEGTTTNETGRIYTTDNGKKYYLADATANIFEPLSESGLQITPYGYLVFEGVYSTRPLDCDWSADFVKPRDRADNTTLSMQDSILGVQFMTPEKMSGWKFSGKAEFDLAGGNQNDYAFHWRHLYVNAEHESGWSILFGQTWHLWKMVTPSEIDGAWMENAGHPYRRSPQLRITKRWELEDSSVEARVGIVKGGPGMGGDRDDDGIEDNTASTWPLVEAALLYDRVSPWQEDKRRWLVGIAGQYGQDRSCRVPDWGTIYGRDDAYESMMGMIAASVPMGDFTLTGQFFGGQDLGGIQAGCAQRVSYNTYYGRGNEVRTIGGFIDLTYQLTDDWSFAVGYGADDPVDSDVEGTINELGILYNDRVYIDAFYQITSNFRLGLEYARLMTSYAETTDVKAGDYDADRIQFSAFYDF